MEIKLNDILSYLEELNFKYDCYGEKNILINSYSSLNNIQNNSITWIKDKPYYKEELFADKKNVLLVVNSTINVKSIKEVNSDSICFIVCDNPKEIFFSILSKFFKQEIFNEYISENSIVETETIGQNVYIGHNCYIGEDVKIGNNVIIKNNVSIEGKVEIGKNTIIHSGVIIGTDGYGYFKNNRGENMKVPHYGGVIIGDNVEIGANTCIDRGTLDDTIIGDNVKIDNLCHIAHNVSIKDNCNIIALSMLGGSAVLYENAYIAPGSLIMNQIKIGENSLVGMGSVIIEDVDENKVVAGVPAKIIRENNKK